MAKIATNSIKSNRLLGRGSFYEAGVVQEIEVTEPLVFTAKELGIDQTLIEIAISQVTDLQTALDAVGGGVFTNYKTNDYDVDGTTSYVGQQEITTGVWLLQKIDDASGDLTITWANISNNALVTTYTDAWTDRATLTYNLIGDLTI